MPFITIKISQDMVEDIDRIAKEFGVEPTLIIDKSFEGGIDFMVRMLNGVGKVKKEAFPFPPDPPIPSSFLDNNNKKKENIISLNQLVAAKKDSRKKQKVSMPKKWVEARDMNTIDEPDLIYYAEKKGYDWYMAKEMFIAFVDYHLAKGNKWADWTRAWYTWVQNDIKFNGPPTKGKVLTSVLKSYQDNTNPIEDFFNGKK